MRNRSWPPQRVSCYCQIPGTSVQQYFEIQILMLFWGKNSWYGEQEILFRLLFRLVGLCQMHKHLTISCTNKQGASIDLILVLWCSPTELTNTPSSSGPTQYFIAAGPTQSNKYKHIRQSFSNHMVAQCPSQPVTGKQSLTKNVQERHIEQQQTNSVTYEVFRDTG